MPFAGARPENTALDLPVKSINDPGPPRPAAATIRHALDAPGRGGPGERQRPRRSRAQARVSGLRDPSFTVTNSVLLDSFGGGAHCPIMSFLSVRQHPAAPCWIATATNLASLQGDSDEEYSLARGRLDASRGLSRRPLRRPLIARTAPHPTFFRRRFRAGAPSAAACRRTRLADIHHQMTCGASQPPGGAICGSKHHVLHSFSSSGTAGSLAKSETAARMVRRRSARDQSRLVDHRTARDLIEDAGAAPALITPH